MLTLKFLDSLIRTLILLPVTDGLLALILVLFLLFLEILLVFLLLGIQVEIHFFKLLVGLFLFVNGILMVFDQLLEFDDIFSPLLDLWDELISLLLLLLSEV